MTVTSRRSNWKAASLAAALMISGMFVPSALAAQVKLVSNPYGTTGGGEFRWTLAPGSAPLAPTAGAAGWTTFCIEYNEHIDYSSTFDATITTYAAEGGQGGGVGGKDPLDSRTAWLFTAFSEGTLAGYNFTDSGLGLSRSATANALQTAIWWIEEEFAVDFKPPGVDDLQRDRARQFYDAATSAASDGGLGNVAVMHLTSLTGGPAQDQIFMNSPPLQDNPPVAPLPLAAVGGVALLATQSLRRLRSR